MTTSSFSSASPRAFTLIELLVVVAVIAILAAIAVPNFLEAQTRSKVSRAKADMRSLRTAIESYAVDQNSYPLNAGGIGLTGALYNLTRPVQYMSSLPNDVFAPQQALYFYFAGGSVTHLGDEKYGHYVLASAGPDRELNTSITGTTLYDPTNGTVSRGDIVATHKNSDALLVGP